MFQKLKQGSVKVFTVVMIGLIPAPLLGVGFLASRSTLNGRDGCTRLGSLWISEGSSETFIDGDDRPIVVSVSSVISSGQNTGSVSIDGRLSPFGDGFLTEDIQVSELVTSANPARVLVAVDHCTNGGR
jgi:hypothetical protein